MKKLLLALLVLFYACGDEPYPECVPDYNESSYSVFRDYNISASDMSQASDELTFLIGNGHSPRSPYIAQLDENYEVSWLKFLTYDERNIYRRMRVHRTLDEHTLILSYSKEEESTEADLRKFDDLGNRSWKRNLSIQNKAVTGEHLVELTNGDFITICKVGDDESYSFSEKVYLLNRITPDGDMIWQKSFETDNFLNISGMAHHQDLNRVDVLFENGNNYSIPLQLQIKSFDEDGNLIIEKNVGSEMQLWPLAAKMIRLNNNDLLVCLSAEAESEHYINVLSLDENFAVTADTDHNSFRNEIIEDFIEGKDGGILLLTSASCNDGLNIVLTRLCNTGLNIEWQRIYGGDASDQGVSLSEQENGDIHIIGVSNFQGPSESSFRAVSIHTNSEGIPY